MERADFVEQAVHILQRARALGGKARREGLLALEGDIDRPKKELRDIFEYGMRFVVDGTAPEIIREILSSLNAQETNQEKRRLKEIQKEAVLCIQTGENPWILLHILLSHLDKNELEILRETHADTFKDFFGGLSRGGSESPDKKEFLELAAELLIKAARFNNKARIEGFLALEDDVESLDDEFLKDGLRLVLEGTDPGIIDRILSRRIALEQEEDERRLKTIQKEAVLGIQEGRSDGILLLLLLSHLANSEFVTLQKTQAGIFQTLLYISAEPVSKKKKEFLDQVAHTVLQLLDFDEKTKTGGLSALEEELEDLDNGFLKDGLRMVLDDIDGDIIYSVLSNRIAQEQDEDARRLKTIQKEVVLSIGAGENARIFLHKLMSHLDNLDLETLRKTHPDIFEGSSEKFPSGGAEAPDEEVTGFVKRLARIVRRACEFSDKARAEGLAALEAVIDESKKERRDIFEYGSQLVTSEAPIDEILSGLISHEPDDETRRLKTIQKEAVLGIQAGENTRMLLHTLLSHIDNSELDALRRTFSYAYISEEFPCGDDTETEEDQPKGFAHHLARIARRACEFSDKARAEGLLALDGLIDEQRIEHRDIFEYGIQFVVDGKDGEAIQKLLSNLVALEQDNDSKRLKEIQKDAVLCIHEGLHPIEFLHILISRVSNSELEALRETAADIFEAFSYEGVEPDGEAGGGTMAPEKSFWILKDLKDALKKSLGSQKASEITSRLTSKLLKDETPELAKEIKSSIFMFEDILMLEDRSIQKLLRDVDTQELVAALTGVDAVVQNRIYRNMSRRAAAILKDRIGHKEQAGAKSGGKPCGRRLETFDDIVMLDDENIQKLLLELDAEELCKALKNADAPVQEKIFRNMSKRTAATIKREIENMTGTVNRKNVEESQQKIISLFHLFEDSGEIAACSDGSEAKEARQNIVSRIRGLESSGEIVIC